MTEHAGLIGLGLLLTLETIVMVACYLRAQELSNLNARHIKVNTTLARRVTEEENRAGEAEILAEYWQNKAEEWEAEVLKLAGVEIPDEQSTSRTHQEPQHAKDTLGR